MPTLERLRAEHGPALLAFEHDNRAYFARSVPDRGDAYFTPSGFAARHASLLAEQEAGTCHFHVVLDEDGSVVGRVNLIDVVDGSAELGYRVGERAAGRGVATAAVAQVCRLAARPYGLTTLTAVTTSDNPASMTVLTRNGFTRVRDVTVDGRPGMSYVRRHLPTETDADIDTDTAKARVNTGNAPSSAHGRYGHHIPTDQFGQNAAQNRTHE